MVVTTVNTYLDAKNFCGAYGTEHACAVIITTVIKTRTSLDSRPHCFFCGPGIEARPGLDQDS